MDNIFDNINNEWANLEDFEGRAFPDYLKILLWKSGYDSMISVKQLTNAAITELEKHIEKNRNKLLMDLESEYDEEVFEFLPGDRHILLNLPRRIDAMQQSFRQIGPTLIEPFAVESYSVVLSELIKTAKGNSNRSKHANHYSDMIKYFSTYIFLLCGRTCYDTLNKNLPIPSIKTICKFDSCLQEIRLHF